LARIGSGARISDLDCRLNISLTSIYAGLFGIFDDFLLAVCRETSTQINQVKDKPVNSYDSVDSQGLSAWHVNFLVLVKSKKTQNEKFI